MVACQHGYPPDQRVTAAINSLSIDLSSLLVCSNKGMDIHALDWIWVFDQDV